MISKYPPSDYLLTARKKHSTDTMKRWRGHHLNATDTGTTWQYVPSDVKQHKVHITYLVLLPPKTCNQKLIELLKITAKR